MVSPALDGSLDYLLKLRLIYREDDVSGPLAIKVGPVALVREVLEEDLLASCIL